jgi:hypothetical protein
MVGDHKRLAPIDDLIGTSAQRTRSNRDPIHQEVDGWIKGRDLAITFDQPLHDFENRTLVGTVRVRCTSQADKAHLVSANPANQPQGFGNPGITPGASRRRQRRKPESSKNIDLCQNLHG